MSSNQNKTLLSTRAFRPRDFERKVGKALDSVRKVLKRAQNPQLADYASNDHSYNDKFQLAEVLTNTALIATWNVLQRLIDNDKAEGRSEVVFQRLLDWANINENSRNVTLRWETKESCTFVKETTKEVISPTREEVVQEEVKEGGKDTTTATTTTTKKHQVKTTVQEFHWECCVEYAIYAFVGNNPSTEEDACKILFQTGHAKCMRVTTAHKDKPPYPVLAYQQPVDVDLTWLLEKLSKQNADGTAIQGTFSIDRMAQSCKTPRGNNEVAQACQFFGSASRWLDDVSTYLRSQRFGRNPGYTTADMAFSNLESSIVVPVLPIFVSNGNNNNNNKEKASPGNVDASSSSSPSSPLLPNRDVNLLLQEQCRSLDAKLGRIREKLVTPDKTDVLTSALASIGMLTLHGKHCTEMYMQGIDHLEYMLHSQMVAAIGKEVKPDDFTEFLKFHFSKFFAKQYVPKSYCYAIRRPNHYPDGTLSIEPTLGGEGSPDPIVTMTRTIQRSDENCMSLPINAATSVQLQGDWHVHGWLLCDFETKMAGHILNGGATFNLVARARQFSSFLLVVGKIAGPETFKPEHAIILQNKDEVLLPLLLKQLPTAKQFKNAIKSLSPEQQRFAKAFRAMQLESSVFGVCVIQLKPQLELLLGLPSNSLTKEIQLTQDLLSLFIEYQTPSDLLTFDGPNDLSSKEKVAIVKDNVAAVLKIIEAAKAKELEEAKQRADLQKANERAAAHSCSAGEGVAASCWDEDDEDAEDWDDDCCEEECFMGMDMRMGASPHLVDPGPGQEESLEIDDRSCDSVAHEDAGDDWLDLTAIPKELDKKFEILDHDDALRPTIISVGESWIKSSQRSLLLKAEAERQTLGADEQKQERNKAFDLLDGLSRSGSLPIASSELHVIVAATHCFDKSLMATVVHDNENPIEKMEKSMAIFASTIHGNVPLPKLVKDEGQLARLNEHSPRLLSSTGLLSEQVDENPDRVVSNPSLQQSVLTFSDFHYYDEGGDY